MFILIYCLWQLPVADGALEGRDLAVRVQWDQQQADEHAASDCTAATDVAATWAVHGEGAVFKAGCRLWKEDAGPIPPREGGTEKIVRTLVVSGNASSI